MKRKYELSFLNILFCVLVILIHVTSTPVTWLSKDSWQCCVFFVPWRLSAFVVQGFIFLSGLKLCLTEKKTSYLSYCLSKFKRIVLPYIFAIIVFYVFFVWRRYFPSNPKEIFGYIVRGDLVAHFYFVIVIVQFYLLKPLWEAMTKYVPAKVAVILSVPILFLTKYIFLEETYGDRIFTSYLTYWVLGCYAGKYFEEFSSHIRKYKKAYIATFFVVAIVESVVSHMHYLGDGARIVEEVHFVYCIFAILAMFAISQMFGEKVMRIKVLSRVDSASYYIYLLHPVFVFMTDEVLRKVGIKDIGTGFVIRATVTYVSSLILAITYTKIMERIKAKRSL